MIFKNIKTVDTYYKYPMSYRFGSIYNEDGIIRIYSNGKNNDYETKKFFYYRIKNDLIKSKFILTKNNNKKIRVFQKIEGGVLDKGEYKVKMVLNNYVRLEKI